MLFAPSTTSTSSPTSSTSSASPTRSFSSLSSPPKQLVHQILIFIKDARGVHIAGNDYIKELLGGRMSTILS